MGRPKQTDLEVLSKVFPDGSYTFEIFNAKYTLLLLKLVRQNQYLDKYLELLNANLTTEKVQYQTQLHHAIPHSIYVSLLCANLSRVVDIGDLRKLADRLASENLAVNLQFTDHILAHGYLYNCARTYEFRRLNRKIVFTLLCTYCPANTCIKRGRLKHYLQDPTFLEQVQLVYNTKVIERGQKISAARKKDG